MLLKAFMTRAISCFAKCWLAIWFSIPAQESRAVETVIVGEVQRPWQAGGGDENSRPPSSTPGFRLGALSREALSGNAPGRAVDFAREPGWLAPLNIDPEINLFQLIRDQGGMVDIRSPNNFDVSRQVMLETLQGVTDGSATVYVRKATPLNRNVNPQGEHINIDLGAPFGLDRILFYPSSAFPTDYLKAFEIKLNDGTILSDSGIPDWHATPAAFRQGQNAQSRTDVRIPLQFVRYMRLTSLSSAGYEIDEIELYGRGFMPTSRYLSDVFDLGQEGALWGLIQWAAEAVGDPLKSAMIVRTRSGDTPAALVLTRRVASATLGEEPFTLPMARAAYERAGLGVTLAPVHLSDQVLKPVEYGLLPREVGDWLQDQRAAYTLLDDSGGEIASTRSAYEATEPGSQVSVFLPAVLIPPNTYEFLPVGVRDWLQERGVEYFRRAASGEDVPYTLDGQPLTPVTYNNRPEVERGLILDDTENWSPWSEPYLNVGSGGSQITSPAPRRFLQFEISFASDLEAARRVDWLSFEFSSPPFARRLIAEVYPRHVPPGESVEFTYAMRALGPSPRGLDSFEIETPVPIERLGEVEIRDAEGVVLDSHAFEVDVDGLALPHESEGGEWALESVDPLRVRFPSITGDGSSLRLRFVTSVLRFGTSFEGWAFNSDSEGQELPQPVVSGNVTRLAPGDADNGSGLTVFTDLEGVPLLSNVRAVPNPFTPNGDGVNDGTQIRYDLLKLTEARPVEVAIYDLAGRRIRVPFADEIDNGRYAVPWDGRDRGGHLVPPGLYLFAVDATAGTGSETTMGTIAVVY